MSKKEERNSPYFMPIDAAQSNIPEGDGALILPLPTPAGVVLRSGTVAVCNLHLQYTDRYVYHIVYSQHFVIECIHLFLSSNEPNILEGNIFYNGQVAEWEIKPNAAFNVLVAPALDILLLLLPGAALSRSPVFSFLILLVNVQLVCLRSYRIL